MRNDDGVKMIDDNVQRFILIGAVSIGRLTVIIEIRIQYLPRKFIFINDKLTKSFVLEYKRFFKNNFD